MLEEQARKLLGVERIPAGLLKQCDLRLGRQHGLIEHGGDHARSVGII